MASLLVLTKPGRLSNNKKRREMGENKPAENRISGLLFFKLKTFKQIYAVTNSSQQITIGFYDCIFII